MLIGFRIQWLNIYFLVMFLSSLMFKQIWRRNLMYNLFLSLLSFPNFISLEFQLIKPSQQPEA